MNDKHTEAVIIIGVLSNDIIYYITLPFNQTQFYS